MKKSVALLVCLTMVSTPAWAQVRPEDCRPVFPLNDPVQAALPQDVIAERVLPAVARSRSFFGLPFLPLLLAGGGCIVFCGGGGNGNNNEAPPPPASPA
jgi:hypothetical protein